MNRKILSAVLALAAVTLVLPFSTVFAASPMIEVSGTISSGSTAPPVYTKEVGQNAFIFLATASKWSGGISGNTLGSQTWIGHNMDGKWHININVELFFTIATVNGRTGSMTVEMNMISYPGQVAENHGTWRIKDATGGLEGLHGEGVWLSGPNRYEGKIHFSL